MLYCAYGSNLHPLRLRARAPSAELLGSAPVSGWELRFHKRSVDGSAKCNIVPSAAKSGTVCVAVFRLDAADLQRLDGVEGVGFGYDHFELAVPDFGTVLTYRAADSHIDDQLRPYPWYKAYVLAGCEYHRFAEGYLRRIKDHPENEDLDLARSQQHMARIRRFGVRE